jgi:hypothetical protein
MSKIDLKQKQAEPNLQLFTSQEELGKAFKWLTIKQTICKVTIYIISGITGTNGLVRLIDGL